MHLCYIIMSILEYILMLLLTSFFLLAFLGLLATSIIMTGAILEPYYILYKRFRSKK